MAMFFKDVDPQQILDPGDELKKVLSFQEKLRAEKNFQYGTFGTTEDFAAKVREFLSTHAIRMLKEVVAPREERPAQPEDIYESPVRKPDAPLQLEAQEADFLLVAAQALRNEIALSPVEVARLRLVATIVGESGNDKQQLGVHDSNLLYTQREEFSFSSHERMGLLDSGLTEIEHENVPVWSWLSELTRERPGLLVLQTALGEEAERVGALIAMRLLGEPIQQLSFFQGVLVEQYWLGSETPAAVRIAALRYLREHGTREQLASVLKEADLATKDTVALANEVAVSILLRENEIKATRHLLTISFEIFDRKLLHQALANLGELGSEELAQGLDHRSPDVRARALQVLSERNALDLETVGRARGDDAAVVRLAAVRAMDRMSQPVSLDEAHEILSRPRLRNPGGLLIFHADTDPIGWEFFRTYRAERLRQMSLQPLEALLGASEHRDAAYQALAGRRIGDFGIRLRADLRDGFHAYFERHWPEGIKSTPGRTLLTLALWDPAEEKQRELVRDALDIVAAQRDHSDLALVRHVLDQQYVEPTATVIAYLKALGDAEDIARLARTPQFSQTRGAEGNFQYNFNEAAQTILRLNSGGFEELMGRAMPEAMRARLVDLVPPGEFAKLDNQAVVKLLLSKDNDVRRAVAKKVPGSLTRSRVRKVLTAYKSDGEGRYYIVTHWLDLGLAYPRPVARRVALFKQ
jgi:hypothetical protein